MLDNLMMGHGGVSRRSLLIGGGLSLALPMQASFDATAATIDTTVERFANPQDMLNLYIKMAGDTSGKNYGGWYSGHTFAVVPGEMIVPLFGVTGFGLGSDRPQPDGSYHHLWKEVGFYTDLKTGEVLETWKNPLNGELCDVMPIHNRSVNGTRSTRQPTIAGFKFMNTNFAQADDPAQPLGFPYAVIGDQISLFLDAVIQRPNTLDPKVWKRESSGEIFNVGEFDMITGSLRQALDPAVTRVDTTGAWSRISAFLPWMMMGQRPGVLFYRSATRKISGPEALPPQLVSYARSRYPEYLEFPNDWSVPYESSWQVYERERTPKS